MKEVVGDVAVYEIPAARVVLPTRVYSGTLMGNVDLPVLDVDVSVHVDSEDQVDAPVPEVQVGVEGKKQKQGEHD